MSFIIIVKYKANTSLGQFPTLEEDLYQAEDMQDKILQDLQAGCLGFFYVQSQSLFVPSSLSTFEIPSSALDTGPETG